jgi:hypothetical protein
VILQWDIDRRFPRRRVEKLLYLPSGRFLKTAVLGYGNLVADYYWFQTIGYFGGHYLADQKYPWLAHILNLVTDLDPRFGVVYSFGGVVLALEAQQVDESIALLEKGMVNLPGNWKLPFYAGFNYFYFKGDLSRAAPLIERAATLPGHPEYLPRLAATLYARAGRVGDAIAFLETVMKSVDDERLRENIRQKIEDLRRGRVPASLDRVVGKGS